MKKYKRFELYLNLVCNQRCLHCFNGRSIRAAGKDLGFSRVCAEMLRMRAKGFDWLSFLGGEPTVYPDILKAVSMGGKLGYRRIMTYSNGLKYADREFTERMRKAGLTDTCLSVHGHDKRLHEAVTRSPGSFEKVLRAIENLERCKVKITLILVLNALNKDKLKEMLRFYASKKITQYMIFFLKYQGRLVEEKSAAKKLMFRVSGLGKTLAEIPGLAAVEGIKIRNIEHVPRCVVPENCRALVAGNDYEDAEMLIQSGEALDVSSSHKGFLFRSACRECRYYRSCAGIDPEYARIFGFGEFKPVKQAGSRRRPGRGPVARG